MYPFRHISTRDYIINENLQEWSLENAFSGQFLPDECYCFVNTVTAASGTYDTSVLNFEDHNIKDLYFQIDNLRYPCLQAEADFDSDNNFMRVFTNFFHTPNWTDKGSWVDLEKMARGKFGHCSILGLLPENKNHRLKTEIEI